MTEASRTYRTTQGHVTVTNAVHKQILTELAHGERQLQDLVDLTGKSKSALSGVYVKDLVQQGLVVERPHAQDSRRKVFRLAAFPEEDVPVVTTAGETRFGLADILRILAAPKDADSATLKAQAIDLGRRVRPVLEAKDASHFATLLGRFAEDEGLARHLQLDFEALRFRCLPGEKVLGAIPPARLAILLAALAEGMAQASGLKGASFRGREDAEAFRIEAT